MRSIESEGGGLVRPEVRPYSEVKKGYTSVLSGDVIMAKITPCMENGKTAVVPQVPGQVCFGPTEFHVFRPERGAQSKWIAHFLLQHEPRRLAQRQTTGGVGQMRVPAAFLESIAIPLAPVEEQARIADALDELFSDLDAGVTALERAREKLKLYRASVLKAAVVVPDNVLFEGGAGEKVRRNLLEKCRVHTLLRLPTGIWYSPGVKANVIFFDKKEGRAKAWTDKLWVYDLRTNLHFTLKQSPIQRKDFDEFVGCCQPGKMHKRKETWSEKNPEGRWRCFDYADLLKRDKLSLDLFWIKDKSLTDTDALPAPDVLATEIADDLEAALGQFTKIAARLKPKD